LLPGFGKKHMQEIINKRKEKEFVSFEDMKKEYKICLILKRLLREEFFKN